MSGPDSHCIMDGSVDPETASVVSLILIGAVTGVTIGSSVAFSRPPGVGTWVALNVLQEMRVWLLLDGDKNKFLHTYFSSDMGWFHLNFPFTRFINEAASRVLELDEATPRLQDIQVEISNVVFNALQ